MLVIDVLSGLGWLQEQLSWPVITLTDMRAALCRAVRILALAYTPVFWSLSSANERGGATNGTSPPPIIDYWPASAESNIVQFDLSALGLTVAPIHAESLCCVEAGGSEADSLLCVCVLLCWCLLKRPPRGIISHSWLLWGRGFATLRLQEPVVLLPIRGL